MKVIARQLVKAYGSRTAVDGIDVTVEPGKILGLLGPNGAGKSTTIKMLAGQLMPTSGSIAIDGQDYSTVPANLRSRIGVMLQDIVLWDSLRLEESLQFMATLQGMSRPVAQERIAWVMNGLQLDTEAKTLSRNLSGGYKRRLHLALTVLHKPTLLFLDEPSPGIDPQSRRLLWDFIGGLRDSGEHAIVLTDHYLEEAERLCDYVTIIDDGRVIAEGTVATLKRGFSDQTIIEVQLSNGARPSNIAAFRAAVARDFGLTLEPEATIQIGVTRVGEGVERLLKQAAKHHVKASHLSIKEPSLEDVFLALTGRHTR